MKKFSTIRCSAKPLSFPLPLRTLGRPLFSTGIAALNRRESACGKDGNLSQLLAISRVSPTGQMQRSAVSLAKIPNYVGGRILTGTTLSAHATERRWL
jgi:hypothetical protein